VAAAAEKATLTTQLTDMQGQLKSAQASTGNIAQSLSVVARDLAAVKQTQKTLVTGMNKVRNC